MIKYCLNIELRFQKNSLRLSDNMKWAECQDPQELNTGDYYSKNAGEIIKLQQIDFKLSWNGKNYLINSSFGISLGADNTGSYEVYCFRDKYPEPPSPEQLKKVLLTGDDNHHNILVLDVNGKFSLFSPNQTISPIINPRIVFQNECFMAGNEYVGNKINDGYVEDIFRTNLYYWKEHLLLKKIHEQSDESYGTNLDDILDIYDELEQIKKQYT